MSKTVLSVRKYEITSNFPNISKLYGKSFPTTFPGTINNGGRLTVTLLTVPHKHYILLFRSNLIPYPFL